MQQLNDGIDLKLKVYYMLTLHYFLYDLYPVIQPQEVQLFNWNKLFFPVRKTFSTWIMASLHFIFPPRQSKNVGSLSTIIHWHVHACIGVEICTYKSLNIPCI